MLCVLQRLAILFSIFMQNTDLKSSTVIEASKADASLINRKIGELFVEYVRFGYGGSPAETALTLDFVVDAMADMASQGFDAQENNYPLLEGFRIINQFRMLMQRVALLMGHPVEEVLLSEAFFDDDLLISARQIETQMRKRQQKA